MKQYLTIVVLWLTAVNVQAQNISSETLTWKVAACLDVGTGISNTPSDQLISYSVERVEWRDEAGNVKATYSIIEANGQWTNVMNNGTILYEVRSDGRQGTIQFTRANGILSIQIVLLKPEENPEKYRFSVATVTAL